MRLTWLKEQLQAAMCAFAILAFVFCVGSLVADPVVFGMIVAVIIFRSVF